MHRIESSRLRPWLSCPSCLHANNLRCLARSSDPGFTQPLEVRRLLKEPYGGYFFYCLFELRFDSCFISNSILVLSPPRLRASAPPRLHAFAPPCSAPPRLRASAPPRLRASAPPRLRASAPYGIVPHVQCVMLFVCYAVAILLCPPALCKLLTKFLWDLHSSRQLPIDFTGSCATY